MKADRLPMAAFSFGHAEVNRWRCQPPKGARTVFTADLIRLKQSEPNPADRPSNLPGSGRSRKPDSVLAPDRVWAASMVVNRHLALASNIPQVLSCRPTLMELCLMYTLWK